ncbi:hypothetical protein MRY87_10395 [bacterium]|nr:hypothetical protein [bacterium]
MTIEGKGSASILLHPSVGRLDGVGNSLEQEQEGSEQPSLDSSIHPADEPQEAPVEVSATADQELSPTEPAMPSIDRSAEYLDPTDPELLAGRAMPSLGVPRDDLRIVSKQPTRNLATREHRDPTAEEQIAARHELEFHVAPIARLRDGYGGRILGNLAPTVAALIDAKSIDATFEKESQEAVPGQTPELDYPGVSDKLQLKKAAMFPSTNDDLQVAAQIVVERLPSYVGSRDKHQFPAVGNIQHPDIQKPCYHEARRMAGTVHEVFAKSGQESRVLARASDSGRYALRRLSSGEVGDLQARRVEKFERQAA